jgi:hypothetical protein
VPDDLLIQRLEDRLLDTAGHDVRGWYVEAFWLPVLGPTAVALLRRLADGLDRCPDGFPITFAELGSSLGLGDRPPTTNAPLTRALRRLESFRFAQLGDDGTIHVRTHVAPIHAKHARRLPAAVRAAHHEWAEAQLARPIDELQQARARRLALCLLGEGEDPDCAERALARQGYPTLLARAAVMWARDRHLVLARTVTSATSTTTTGDLPAQPA